MDVCFVLVLQLLFLTTIQCINGASTKKSLGSRHGRAYTVAQTPPPRQFQQPLTPVYHATPIMPFESLRIHPVKPNPVVAAPKPVPNPHFEALARPIVSDINSLYTLQHPLKTAYSNGINPFFSLPLHHQPIQEIVTPKPVHIVPEHHIEPLTVPDYHPTPLHDLDTSLQAPYDPDDDNDWPVQWPAKYQFSYKVHDRHGNDFGHTESREGNITKGHYHVLLPDGRLQNVHYWVDHTGYHATVTYNTISKHPS